MSDLNTEALDELEILLYYEYLDTLRNDFWKFCLYFDPDFFNERTFLKECAELFQNVHNGIYKKVSISLPPRYGKSYLTSIYCLWVLGNNPSASILRTSCTVSLANKFSYDIRGFVSDPRTLEVFPELKLAPDKAAIGAWNTTESIGVGYLSGGSGSTIIGFGAETIAICDDTIKDVEMAMSEPQLEKLWEWFGGMFRSRKEKGCPEIHIGTRWSRRDVIGKLEATKEFDKQIVIQALTKDNKSFCEEIISTEDLLIQKRNLPTAIFEAEYQQNPIEAKGLLYPRDELNYFEGEIILDTPTVCVVDVADTGGDYLSAIFAKTDAEKAYIDDVIFTQEPVEITTPLLARKLIEHQVSVCRIESNNAGRIFALNVEALLKTLGGTTEIQTRATKTNKETRMYLRSGFIKTNFHFRKDPKGDYIPYLSQLVSTFKNVAKNIHDDAADNTTMMAEFIENSLMHNW